MPRCAAGTDIYANATRNDALLSRSSGKLSTAAKKIGATTRRATLADVLLGGGSYAAEVAVREGVAPRGED